MKLKTNRKKEAEKTTEEILNLLYYLEDLNSHRKNKLNEIIKYFKCLEWSLK